MGIPKKKSILSKIFVEEGLYQVVIDFTFNHSASARQKVKVRSGMAFVWSLDLGYRIRRNTTCVYELLTEGGIIGMPCLFVIACLLALSYSSYNDGMSFCDLV